MMNKTHIFGSLLLGGWALLSLVGKARLDAKRYEKQTLKEDIKTWEGEGGNLPPPMDSVGHAATIAAKS